MLINSDEVLLQHADDQVSARGLMLTHTRLRKRIMVHSAHLATASATPELPVILEAPVIIATDPAVVKLGAADESHTVLCGLPRVVDHKAEAAWGLLGLVQTHDNALDGSSL